MANLSDTQLVLLGHAAQQDNGSLLPFPATITAPRSAINRAIAALLKLGFAEAGKVADARAAWRHEGDTGFGVRVTAAGREAIGLVDTLPPSSLDQHPTSEPKKQSKGMLVLGLLQRGDGATLVELAEATGWLPHTTRAALTALRKRGVVIDKNKRGAVTLYHVRQEA